MTIPRFLALLASLSALHCGPTEPQSPTVGDADDGKSYELNVGDTLTVRLTGSGGTGQNWILWNYDAVDVLEDASGRDPGTMSPTAYSYNAVGAGETTLAFLLQDPNQTQTPRFEISVKVNGEPRPERERKGPWQGFEPYGGYGNSIESGRKVTELRLRPTDLSVGRKDKLLYVVSEGRLWRIDPATDVGTMVLDEAGARTGSALPEGFQITGAEQLDNGDFLLALRLAKENRVGTLSEAGAWTQLSAAPDSDYELDRIRGAPGNPADNVSGGEWDAAGNYVGSTATHLVAGRSKEGDVFMWSGGRQLNGTDTMTLHLMKDGTPQKLFDFLPSIVGDTEVEFDFLRKARVGPPSPHRARVASLAQTDDGRLFTYKAALIDGTTANAYTIGTGLYTRAHEKAR